MKSESKLRKVSRALAITGSVIILVAIISLLIAAIVPSVIASISGLMKTLPNDVAAFINMIKHRNFTRGSKQMDDKAPVRSNQNGIYNWKLFNRLTSEDYLPCRLNKITPKSNSDYRILSIRQRELLFDILPCDGHDKKEIILMA